MHLTKDATLMRRIGSAAAWPILGICLMSLTARTPAADAAQAPPTAKVFAAPSITIDVWPATAPGDQTSSPGKISDDHGGGVIRMTHVTRPQLQIFPAPGKGAHPAVLVSPGGGYEILAMDLEGTEIAAWLNGLGFTAAVLTYRVPGKRDAAFQDAQRALSLLRARAKDFGIDAKHVGALGFSAGGHLTARLAASYGVRSYAPIDDIDKQSDRPDFAALIYPAYLFDSATGLPAPEVAPHPGMPPIFLTQTLDDPYLDAPAYATALEQSGAPTRGVYYLKGGHGYGLRSPANQPVHGWADAAGAWLKEQVGKK